MEIIRKRAYARAGLVGNPSDGYHGRTIALIVRNFFAEVTLYEWDRIEVVFSRNDQTRFDSIDDLIDDVQLHGYYGGVRLVKATIKKFVEYCRRHNHRLHNQTFAVRYSSTIPRCVGMAGSSALVIATLRCLMEFYGVEIPLIIQPSLALSVETEELGIAAGLQDRVVQTYEGLVYMDFARDRAEQRGGYDCGAYQPLEAAQLPPLYLAYSTERSEPTETTHNNLRHRYQQGDRAVVDAMEQFAQLTVEARAAIEQGNHEHLGRLIDANFDLRRSICDLPHRQAAMVDRARSVGATAKFAGSGGAIIGTCADDACFDDLAAALNPLACHVIRPEILPG